jgi:hypothetical protein
MSTGFLRQASNSGERSDTSRGMPSLRREIGDDGIKLRPAHVSLRRRWGRRTNNSEPLATYAVSYVPGCSAFLAAPLPASHAATTPVVEDLDIGLVRERSTERCEESFVIGVNDEQLARHTAITAPRGRLSSAE